MVPQIAIEVNGPFTCLLMQNCYETAKGGVVWFGGLLYNIYANQPHIRVRGVEPIVDQEEVAKIQAVCRKMQAALKALLYCEPVENGEHCVCISEFGVAHYIVYGGR